MHTSKTYYDLPNYCIYPNIQQVISDKNAHLCFRILDPPRIKVRVVYSSRHLQWIRDNDQSWFVSPCVRSVSLVYSLCELQCLAYFHTVVVAAAVLAFFLVVVFSWPKGKFVEMEDPVMGSKSWGNWTCMSGVGILDGIVTIVHRPAVSIVVSRSGGRSFMVASYPCGAAATTHALEYLSTPNC